MIEFSEGDRPVVETVEAKHVERVETVEDVESLSKSLLLVDIGVKVAAIRFKTCFVNAGLRDGAAASFESPGQREIDQIGQLCGPDPRSGGLSALCQALSFVRASIQRNASRDSISWIHSVCYAGRSARFIDYQPTSERSFNAHFCPLARTYSRCAPPPSWSREGVLSGS